MMTTEKFDFLKMMKEIQEDEGQYDTKKEVKKLSQDDIAQLFAKKKARSKSVSATPANPNASATPDSLMSVSLNDSAMSSNLNDSVMSGNLNDSLISVNDSLMPSDKQKTT